MTFDYTKLLELVMSRLTAGGKYGISLEPNKIQEKGIPLHSVIASYPIFTI